MAENTTNAPPAESRFRIDFIDPLFAVAIHIGFVEGLMREPWFHERRIPVSLSDYSDLTLFSAGLWFLALSWVGYHTSIQRRPILSDARFILDIALLILYMFLLLYFEEPSKFAAIFCVVFGIYTVWDFYKTKEHRVLDTDALTFLSYIKACLGGWLFAGSHPRLKGEIVTVGWTMVAVILVPFAFLPLAARDFGKRLIPLRPGRQDVVAGGAGSW